MSIHLPLPWHDAQANIFLDLAKRDRLGHAWLIVGAEGSGKKRWVQFVAASLLCQKSKTQINSLFDENNEVAIQSFCGTCSSCHLFSQHSHPDFHLIQPEKKLILVDQVREAAQQAYGTAQRGGWKILVITPAEAMNVNAANALLKVLEEPPASTLLFLLANQPSQLLATLRSRCQQIKLGVPKKVEALAWLEERGCGASAPRLLQLAHGSPLKAISLSENGNMGDHDSLLDTLSKLAQKKFGVVHAAKLQEGLEITSLLTDMQQICHQIVVSLQATTPPLDQAVNALLDGVTPRRIHYLYGELNKLRRLAMSSNNPNATLLLEEAFNLWQQCLRV
jgi:DNA polymerase-3 subunit delta'